MNGGKQINFWWQIDADVASLHVCVCVRLCWGYFQWQCRRNLGPRETGKRGRKTHPESPGTAEPDIKEEKKRKQKKKGKKENGAGRRWRQRDAADADVGRCRRRRRRRRRNGTPSECAVAGVSYFYAVGEKNRTTAASISNRPQKKTNKKTVAPVAKVPGIPFVFIRSGFTLSPLRSILFSSLFFFVFFFQFLKTIFLLLAGWKRARGNIREPCRSARFPNVFFLLRSDQNIAWNWMMTLWVHFDELELPPTIPSISRRDRLAEWQYLFFLFKWIQRELFRLPKLGQNSTFSVAFTGFLAPSFRCQMPKAKHFDNEKSFIYRYLMSTIDS